MTDNESPFESLKNQLLQEQKPNAVSKQKTDEVPLQQQTSGGREIRAGREEEPRADADEDGDDSDEAEKEALDDETLVEFMADKKPVKMTLKELKERAAGDVAVKSRMAQLAQEKKKVKETFTSFSKLSKDDPLRALEELSKRIGEVDPDFSFENYLTALADQAQRYAQMDAGELKAQRLQQKLENMEEKLTHKEEESLVAERVEEVKESLGISENDFQSYVDYLLENDPDVERIQGDLELVERVEQFAYEVQLQTAAFNVISDIVPSMPPNDPFVLEMASLIKNNPDFDEDDIRDIVHGVFQKSLRDRGPAQKRKPGEVDVKRLEAQGAPPFEILKAKLLQEKQTAAR